MINGELHLIPQGEPYEQLRHDYTEMVETGYILGDHISFDQLMASIRELEDHINAMMSRKISGDEHGF